MLASLRAELLVLRKSKVARALVLTAPLLTGPGSMIMASLWSPATVSGHDHGLRCHLAAKVKQRGDGAESVGDGARTVTGSASPDPGLPSALAQGPADPAGKGLACGLRVCNGRYG